MALAERRGYSLIELMLVVAIVGSIAMVGPRLMIQMTRFFRQNQARVDIQREARTVFDLMGRNLRQAQASTIVVDQLSGQPPYSRVSFTKRTSPVLRVSKGTETSAPTNWLGRRKLTRTRGTGRSPEYVSPASTREGTRYLPTKVAATPHNG